MLVVAEPARIYVVVQGGPASFGVTLRYKQANLFDGIATPTYEDYFPNGESCPGHCRNGHATVVATSN